MRYLFRCNSLKAYRLLAQQAAIPGEGKGSIREIHLIHNPDYYSKRKSPSSLTIHHYSGQKYVFNEKVASDSTQWAGHRTFWFKHLPNGDKGKYNRVTEECVAGCI